MELPDAARRLLFVDRHRTTLTLYSRRREEEKFDVEAGYRIAVGAEGYRTPRGIYVINSKVKDPDWTVPNSQWAIDQGLWPGTVIPGGTPANPLKERWLGVTEPSEGVGIHGTASLESLGTAASHGCIRMDPEEVIELYERVPIGTPAVIF